MGRRVPKIPQIQQPKPIMGSAAPPAVGWWRSSITGPDNVTIDPTFLCVMWAVFVVLPFIILSLVSLSVLDVSLNNHEASVGALGGGIAAVIAAVGAFVTGMAVVLSQDKKPTPPSTTTTAQVTTTTNP